MTDALRETVNARRAELEHAPPIPSPTAAAFANITPGQVLKTIGLDPSNAVSHAVVAVAERYGLDPVLGHIQIIPGSSMPYVTRDGFLFVAHRSGQLDGIEVVDGPRREGAEWVAKVAIYRKDMSRPFIYPGRADVGRDNAPEMALARAERRALRRAFAVTLPREFADDEHDTRAPTAAPNVAEIVDELEPEPDMITKTQLPALQAGFRDLGITDRNERLEITREIVGRDDVGIANDLTRLEAQAVIDELSQRKLDARLERDAEAARAAVTESQIEAAYDDETGELIEDAQLPGFDGDD